jgi:hypothetical protein
VAEFTVKLAPTPPKSTDVAPVKFVPLIDTLSPISPLAGAKELITGSGAVTIKSALLVPVPPGPVTEIGPVVAPLGTVAVIWVAEFTVKLAPTPPKATDVAPVKFAPLIDTLAPTCPLVGAKELIAGTTFTVKSVLLVPAPPGPVTVIGPVVAPPGTVAVI